MRPVRPNAMRLKARLATMAKEDLEIPLIIGGREIRTGRTQQTVMPFSHRHVLAEWHMADARHVRQAIEAARRAQREWSAWPWEDRAAVFLKAAELLATEWRATINAATMLGQAKTAFQSEIDAACELIDFWRFNVAYAAEIYADQPVNGPGVWNQSEYRPLEGFVYAVSPFNFTSIAGNLPDGARPHGRRRDLEAGVELDVERVSHHAPAHGRRPATGRRELRSG